MPQSKVNEIKQKTSQLTAAVKARSSTNAAMVDASVNTETWFNIEKNNRI